MRSAPPLPHHPTRLLSHRRRRRLVPGARALARSLAAYTRCISLPLHRTERGRASSAFPHAPWCIKSTTQARAVAEQQHYSDGGGDGGVGGTLSLFHHRVLYTPTTTTHTHTLSRIHIHTRKNSVNGRRQFGVLLTLCKSSAYSHTHTRIYTTVFPI